jgi:hypothetical protein
MATIESLQNRLKKEVDKKDKAIANIKRLQDEIKHLETQEVMNTLNELHLSPAQAKALLQKAKTTILSAAQADGVSDDGEGESDD